MYNCRKNHVSRIIHENREPAFASVVTFSNIYIYGMSAMLSMTVKTCDLSILINCTPTLYASLCIRSNVSFIIFFSTKNYI